MKTDSASIKNVLLACAEQRTILHWRASLEISYRVELVDKLETLFDYFRSERNFSMLVIDYALLKNDYERSLSRLKQSLNDSKILLIGRNCEREIQIKAFSEGIPGYMEVDLKAELIRKGVDRLLQGEVWVERQMVTSLLDVLRKQNGQPDEIPNQENLSLLTPREIEIARRVCLGDSNKRIANHLDITERTVKAHLSSIFRKLEVFDRLQLALQLKDSFPKATESEKVS